MFSNGIDWQWQGCYDSAICLMLGDVAFGITLTEVIMTCVWREFIHPKVLIRLFIIRQCTWRVRGYHGLSENYLFSIGFLKNLKIIAKQLLTLQPIKNA